MASSHLVVALCLALAAASPAEEKFKDFVRAFEKTYESEEEQQRRFEIFRSNLADIEKLQSIDGGSATYSHLTPFADLSTEEFSVRLGLKPVDSLTTTVPLAAALDTSSLPDSFDWRDHGAVNPVKNQEQCGSCWAFATVANIEGAGYVENKKLLSLSEQELVDCDKKTGDEGCRGGLPANAYTDMIQNKIGLEQETAYPYTARDGTCKASASMEKAFIGGFVKISTDEDQIAAAVANAVSTLATVQGGSDGPEKKPTPSEKEKCESRNGDWCYSAGCCEDPKSCFGDGDEDAPYACY